MLRLVSKKSDLIVKNLGYSVDDAEYKTGTYEANDTYNESNDVLGLKITKNSVNSGYYVSKEEEEQNLSNLRKALKLSSNGIGCHFFVSPCISICKKYTCSIKYSTVLDFFQVKKTNFFKTFYLHSTVYEAAIEIRTDYLIISLLGPVDV